MGKIPLRGPPLSFTNISKLMMTDAILLSLQNQLSYSQPLRIKSLTLTMLEIASWLVVQCRRVPLGSLYSSCLTTRLLPRVCLAARTSRCIQWTYFWVWRVLGHTHAEWSQTHPATWSFSPLILQVNYVISIYCNQWLIMPRCVAARGIW